MCVFALFLSKSSLALQHLPALLLPFSRATLPWPLLSLSQIAAPHAGPETMRQLTDWRTQNLGRGGVPQDSAALRKRVSGLLESLPPEPHAITSPVVEILYSVFTNNNIGKRI
jgi:hypothetical protein